MAFNRSEDMEKVAYYALVEAAGEEDSLYFHIIFCSL